MACWASRCWLASSAKPSEISSVFQINASEATARADQVLRDNKLDPASYQHATTIAYTFDGYTNEYLRRTIGIAAANRVYRDQVPSAFWTVRYFRDSQNEEYMVVLQPDGSLHSLHHTLDEKAPGANLTKEEALARAEAYLRDQKKTRSLGRGIWSSPTPTSALPGPTTHSSGNRRWRSMPRTGQQGAHVRMQVQVQGDEVSGYRVFIKIPEAWRDAESRTTTAQIAANIRQGAPYRRGILITVLVIFLRSLKHPEIAQVPWHALGKWCILGARSGNCDFVNRAPQLLANYTTTWPLKTYYAILTISLVFITAIYLAAALLLLGLSWFFLERVVRPRAHSGMGRDAPEYYRDAFLRRVVRCGGTDGARPPAGTFRALAAFAAHAGCGRARRAGHAKSGGWNRLLLESRQFFYRRTGWFGVRH